jgi:ribosomal protein L23
MNFNKGLTGYSAQLINENSIDINNQNYKANSLNNMNNLININNTESTSSLNPLKVLNNLQPINLPTLNIKTKKKRVGRYTGRTNRGKKAIVTLKDGMTIENI